MKSVEAPRAVQGLAARAERRTMCNLALWAMAAALVAPLPVPAVANPSVTQPATPAIAVTKATPTGKAAASAAAPARGGQASKSATAAAAAPALPSGKGWRAGPLPGWVVEPPVPPPGGTPAPAVGDRRELLLDVQSNYALPKPQTLIRWRSVALNATALGAVSQPQVRFNPAYQTVLLHSAAVLRDGRRIEQLATARMELMRREQRLEQQMIDGAETLLIVLSDVRVGEPVEVAYTIEGENPIFEGHIGSGIRLAYDAPLDQLHYRLSVPAGRALYTKGLAGAPAPERFSDNGLDVVRAVRHNLPALVMEQGTPPWFKAAPALQVTSFASWTEVDAWAQRLFALPSPTHPAVVARAAAFREQATKDKWDDAALVAEVLRFVQDEVRYFSASLGESSHRPKPPDRTLAELLGDCKDKVQLLNALLRELGFDARPALVSTVRGRGLLDFLPSHDEFDHVVTQLELGGRSWLLDATVNGQGLTLAGRGQWPFGAALVVGGGGTLRSVPEAADAVNALDFEQRWDLSRPGQPATLTTVLTASGLMAERWRAGAAAGGTQRVAEALAGGFARVAPGLQAVGTPQLDDDRQANVLQLRQTFTHADFGTYSRGGLDAEFVALELLDLLVGPQEVTRRMPYWLDQPRLAQSRIVVVVPNTTAQMKMAPATEINDRHFRYSMKSDSSANTVTVVRRFERRGDQVLPGDVASYRDAVLRARGNAANRLRLQLLDSGKLLPDFEAAERRLRASRSWRNDALGSLLARNEFGRVVDSKTLAVIQPGSPLAAHVLASRAQASNLLGDFNAALADADASLAILPQEEAALEARAVALLGAGDAEQSLAEFTRLSQLAQRAATSAWRGSVALHLGRPAEAETLLREAVEASSSDERDFPLIWLYLAAERQGGRGQAAIAPYLASNGDNVRFSSALLQFLNGSLERDALLKRARDKPELERLNMAEACFYIGQQLAARGQQDEAQRWFERTVDTAATPYREVTFAQLELKRGKVVAARP